jgi:NDP-sugar pyrophosphorylase family protein
MSVEVSREEILLDTGGGLKNAARFFLANSSEPEGPFILHNVDVISTIDFPRMLQFHLENRALATLAMRSRKSSRYLLFDQQFQLCGRRSGRDGAIELVRPSEQLQALAFCGIHISSPRLFAKMTEEGVFSIIDCYLRLAGREEKILAFRADEYYWHDLGTPDKVRQAAQDLKQKQ